MIHGLTLLSSTESCLRANPQAIYFMFVLWVKVVQEQENEYIKKKDCCVCCLVTFVC